MSKSTLTTLPNNAPLFDAKLFSLVKNTIFPDVKSDEAIVMAMEYCKAKNLDIMLKPVHIIQRKKKIKNANGRDEYVSRWEILAGIGTNRITASRTGQFVGVSEPEFGPDITETLGDAVVTYPEYAKVTVKRKVGDMVAEFTAIEYWKENYATKAYGSVEPNEMWKKRPKGQLAKCAEAQAFRKGFPEVGQEPTFDEMEGKFHVEPEKSTNQTITVNDVPRIEVDETKRLDAIAILTEASTIDELKNAYVEAINYVGDDMEGRKIINKETHKLKAKFTVRDFNQEIEAAEVEEKKNE